MKHSKRIYTKKQLSEELSVCIRTIDNWISSGKIGYSKVCRRVLFTQDDIEDFMAKNHRPSESQLREPSYDYVNARYTSLINKTNKP
jgi:excisionase family DNA binding protein